MAIGWDEFLVAIDQLQADQYRSGEFLHLMIASGYQAGLLRDHLRKQDCRLMWLGPDGPPVKYPASPTNRDETQPRVWVGPASEFCFHFLRLQLAKSDLLNEFTKGTCVLVNVDAEQMRTPHQIVHDSQDLSSITLSDFVLNYHSIVRLSVGCLKFDLGAYRLANWAI